MPKNWQKIVQKVMFLTKFCDIICCIKENDMKIVTLGSGSKGNCTLVASDTTKVLIDAGLPLSEIETKLTFLGVDPKNINGILITHEHSDHIKSIGMFSKKYGTPVFAHLTEWPVLDSKIKGVASQNKVAFSDADFYIGDLTISTFKLSHDANLCLGYSVFNNGAKFSIATDLGFCPPEIVEKLKGSNLVILEANHDENLLANNSKYPVVLKKRILSKKGHLSNRASAEVIAQLVGGTNQVVLGHLSEENNSPSLAYNTIKAILAQKGIVEGKNIFIDVAMQHRLGNIFEIKTKTALKKEA